MEKINFTYRLLCNLSFENLAFQKENSNKWLSIKPSLKTLGLMQLNGIKSIETATGQALLAKTVTGTNKPLFPIKGLALEFILSFTNQNAALLSALPKKDDKFYVFGNKKAFDGGQNSNAIYLPPLNGSAEIADEIVKSGPNFKMAFYDYSNVANPPPLALKTLADGDFASTSNLESIANPADFQLSSKDLGILKILIDEHAVLGNSYKLLLANGDISTKTFIIRIKNAA